MEIKPKIVKFEEATGYQRAPGCKSFVFIDPTGKLGKEKSEYICLLTFMGLPGADIPEHRHDVEEMWMVVRGRMTQKIGDKEYILEKGDFCCMPPGVWHSGKILGDEMCQCVTALAPKYSLEWKQAKEE